MVILNPRRREIQVAQLISSKHFSIKVFRYSYSLALRNTLKKSESRTSEQTKNRVN